MSLANKITLSRIVFGPLFLWFMALNLKWLAFFILFSNLFFDIIDGYLAREKKETTRLGEVIDPLVDLLFFSFCAFSFNLMGIVEVNYFLIFIFFIGLAFILPILKKKEIKVFHTKSKYLHTPLVYIMVAFLIFGFQDNKAILVLFWITLVMLILSSSNVFWRSLKYSFAKDK